MAGSTRAMRCRGRDGETLGLALAILLIACRVLLGCSEKEGPAGTDPQAAADLPPLTLTDDTPDLLLTWIDEKGEAHTEIALADVPEEGKKLVRVVVTNKEEGQGSRLYVADLTSKQPDGTYPVRTMTRHEWEGLIEQRREAYIAKHVPKHPTTAPSGAPTTTDHGGGLVAIIYGASWCKPCHQAKAHLERRGVKVIEKDIEKDSKAHAEMQRKLKRVGRPGATIPIIDLNGQIIIGYSTATLDRAIKKARGGTLL